jgi:hypothetical protein
VVGLEGQLEFKALATLALESVVSREIPIDSMDVDIGQELMPPPGWDTLSPRREGGGLQRPGEESPSGWKNFGDE